MNHKKMILLPQLKYHLTAGAFAIGLGLGDEGRIVMQIVQVHENNSVEVCLHPSCTHDILRLMHQQEGHISNIEETHESNAHCMINAIDTADTAHVLHCINVNNKVKNASGIDNFFCMQFKIIDHNDASNIVSNEAYYPFDDARWHEIHARPSCSKNILINLMRIQESTQKMLLKSTITQSTYS